MADISFHLTGEALWRRMDRAVEKVQERLERTVTTLERAGIPYAIIGGNAVRVWVAHADEAAVRTTRDVDILLRRSDFPDAKVALESKGFVYRPSLSMEMFLDSPTAKSRESVRIVFAKEKVFPDDFFSAPDVTDSVRIDTYRILTMEALVQMELTSFRTKSHVHLRDMIDVELVDESWCARFPPELAVRLMELLDNPNG